MGKCDRLCGQYRNAIGKRTGRYALLGATTLALGVGARDCAAPIETADAIGVAAPEVSFQGSRGADLVGRVYLPNVVHPAAQAGAVGQALATPTPPTEGPAAPFATCEVWIAAFVSDLLERRIFREYDATGGLVQERIDDGADGSVDWVVKWAYDQLGRALLQQEWYRGRLSRAITFTHAGGRLTEETRDINGDERVDQVLRYGYDAWSNLRSISFNVLRENAGQTEIWYGYSYDSRGHLVREVVDEDGDGVADLVGVYEWEGAFPVRVSWNDGEVDTLSYDMAGRLIRRSFSLEETLTDEYQYGPQGWLSGWERNRGGEPELVVVREYDDTGKRVLETIARQHYPVTRTEYAYEGCAASAGANETYALGTPGQEPHLDDQTLTNGLGAAARRQAGLRSPRPRD